MKSLEKHKDYWRRGTAPYREQLRWPAAPAWEKDGVRTRERCLQNDEAGEEASDEALSSKAWSIQKGRIGHAEGSRATEIFSKDADVKCL